MARKRPGEEEGIAHVVVRAQRGVRIRQIRESREETGEVFAKALNDLARAYGMDPRYDRAEVSRMETGARKVTVEEAAMLVELDAENENRGLNWLVFGTPPVRAAAHKRAGR